MIERLRWRIWEWGPPLDESLTCRRNQSNLNPEKSNFSSLSTIKTEANVKKMINTAPNTWLRRMAACSEFSYPGLWLTDLCQPSRSSAASTFHHLPCLRFREDSVLTNEDIMMDSSSGHTERFWKKSRRCTQCSQVHRMENAATGSVNVWRWKELLAVKTRKSKQGTYRAA